MQAQSQNEGGYRYHDVRYHHPLFYVMVLAAAIVSLAMAGWMMLGGGLTSAAIVLAIGGAGLLLWCAACGRLQVLVDEQQLQLAYGFGGLLRHSINLDDVERVRVRLFTALPARFVARAQRGVELTYGHRRYLIGSRDPEALRMALLREAAETDEAPEYLREEVSLPQRRRVRRFQTWALVHPAEFEI